MSKTFCPLPWIHLGTHPHGGVTPCCISDMTAGKNRARNYTDHGDEFYNLNDHSIDKHMNSDYFKEIRLEMLNDVEPKACTRCYQEERKGIKMAFLKYAKAQVVTPQLHGLEWDRIRVASGATKLNSSLKKKAEEL